MPKTRSEIDSAWKTLHDKLTRLYYVEKKVSREFFEKAHAAIWLQHEKECIENGLLPDFITDEATGKMRLQQIVEMLNALKIKDVDVLIDQLKAT